MKSFRCCKRNVFTRKDLYGSFDKLAKEALDLLGVKWQPSTAEQSYNASLTTQIPINTQVLINDRFNRTINVDNFKLRVQRK